MLCVMSIFMYLRAAGPPTEKGLDLRAEPVRRPLVRVRAFLPADRDSPPRVIPSTRKEVRCWECTVFPAIGLDSGFSWGELYQVAVRGQMSVQFR